MSQISAHHAVARRVGDTAVLDSRPAGEPRGTALLVPGYTGSKEDFADLLDPLSARGFRVVAMDQPGQYESAGPDDVTAYTTDWMGSVIREVARTLGPVHLLGHSYGGLTGRAAVIAEPALFRSLTLLASGPARPDGARTAQIDVLESVHASGGMDAVFDQLERLAMADPAWQSRPRELRDFARRRFVASSWAGLRGMGHGLVTEPDRVDELRATGVRLLVAYGEHDDAWSPAAQAAMAERLGARNEMIAGAIHSPAIEATEATVKLLDDFWSPA
ncbi:alpha/beta fold hydrolase [Fodinicola acaciae]|uniref:alpha/beta fold hydrolase n=1 Tax=Fodinicola acaciae TaxID=2681555 RepID=UPI0013D139C7|nr:alpha/beta fold hydrolase [Fodinicola acaciae]